MRLINTRTHELEEYFDTATPKYAILSHTWQKEELVLRDMEDLGRAAKKAGFAKFEGACAVAASQGHDYIWIDTCCIDQSSSAELSEAINCMYKWYSQAVVCYAYLCDVHEPSQSQLGSSRWFTRGWTLQELIAPGRVEFYAADWTYIGEKQDGGLISTIARASWVDHCVLSGVVHVRDVSVAKRMYWASNRSTTRKEDEAYCLLGLFGVNMPLLYGEGPTKAFLRLQQQIVKGTQDQSILAWYCEGGTDPDSGTGRSIFFMSGFAPSPKCFARSGDIGLRPPTYNSLRLRMDDAQEPVTEFHAILSPGDEGGYLVAVLYCQLGSVPGTFPTLLLRRDRRNPRLFYREMRHGLVTKFSMYGHGPSLAALTVDSFGTHRLDLDMDQAVRQTADGGPQDLLYKDATGMERQFQLELVRLRATYVLFDQEPKITKPKLRMQLGSYVCWLVPRQTDGSRVTISVADALPAKNWVSSSMQFYLDAQVPVDHSGRLVQVTTVNGVARLELSRPGTGPDSEYEHLGSAVVGVGLCIHPKRDPGIFFTKAWCSLAMHDRFTSLEMHLASGSTIQDGKEDVSLTLRPDLVLHASVRQAMVFGELVYLLGLWTEFYDATRSNGEAWSSKPGRETSIQINGASSKVPDS